MSVLFKQTQGTGESTNSLTTSLTTSASAVSGNSIFVWIDWDQSTRSITSVTDSASNTYSLEHTKLINGRSASIWGSTLTSNLPAGSTIAVNWNGTSTSHRVVIAAAEFSGVTLTEDCENDNNNATLTPSPSASGFITNTGTLALANVCQLVTPSGDLSDNSPWTTLYDIKHSAISLVLHAAYAINLTPGANTYAPNSALGGGWTAILDVLIASSATTTQARTSTLLTLEAG